MIRIQMHHDADAKIAKDPSVGRELRKVAETVKGRVRAPKDMSLTVHAGVSRRGAFSQVIMRGPNAVFVEFGSRTRRALAPLRNALRGAIKL
jgi:hypothetical protein